MSTIYLANSASVGTYSSHLEGKIEWSQTTDNSTNKSTIIADIYVRKAASIELTTSTTGTWSYQINIGGNTITTTWYGSVLGWTKVGSHSATLTHNNDGTLTATVSGYVSSPSGTSWSGLTTSGSESVKLPTVPRASSVYSVSNCKAGEAPTVKWYPLSKDFRYDYKIEIGSYSTGWSAGYIDPKQTSLYSSNLHTIDKSAANQISASSTTKTGTVTLRTWDASNNQLGTATKTFTLSLPDDAVPTDSITVSPVDSPAAFSSLYIQGKTKVRVVHTSSAKYGASISKQWFHFNGNDYSGSTATTGYLNIYGTYSIQGGATDSRGLSGYSAVSDIYFYPYAKPVLTSADGETKIICVRCDEYGEVSDDGTRLKVKCKVGCSELNGANVPTLQIRCRPNSGSWTEWRTLVTTDGEFSGVVPNAELSIYSTYDVELKVSDTVGESVIFPTSISTAFYTLHLRAGGRGVAIGKFSEKEDTFECALSAEFAEMIKCADALLVDSGHSDNDSTYSDYIKFADGTMFQWGSKLVNVSLSQIGSTGIYTQGVTITPPIPFVGSWILWGGSKFSTGHNVPFSGVYSSGEYQMVHVYDFYARSGGDMTVNWVSIGRWK